MNRTTTLPGNEEAPDNPAVHTRAVNVTASVDPQIASTAALVADLRERILPAMRTEFPDVFYTFRGAQEAQEAQEEAIRGLRVGFVLALILIFGCSRFRCGRTRSRSSSWVPLFLVPVSYAILDDLQRLPRALSESLGAAPRVSRPATGA